MLTTYDEQYWKRDARRKYPQLSVVTQTELSQLLLGESSQAAYVNLQASGPLCRHAYGQMLICF